MEIPEMHTRVFEARPAAYKTPATQMSPAVAGYLANRGISLYTHQADAYDAVTAGKNIILTTPTASGKTLAYALPVFEKLMQNRDATALFIYPTKALTRDQLAVFDKLDKDLGAKTRPAIYDGDTPREARGRIRSSSRIILTNMYELHQILAWRTQWGDFWTNLGAVVIDEAHRYRGVFGSHIALLLRRLRRICSYYDARPQFVLSSATIGGAETFAETLTGLPAVEIANDGSPRAKQTFRLYNPSASGKSSITATADLIRDQVQSGMQTLCFTKSRNMAEITAMRCREDMPNTGISSYRGGYRPNERRNIEKNLKEGDLSGVISTNALELGIDVGGLDSVIISGFPGTMMSVRQQAGRAGRAGKDALITFVAQQNPLDQYFMRHPDAFFDAPCEQPILDLENPYVLRDHLLCAAAELPYRTERDAAYFGETAADILPALKDEHLIASTPKGFVYCGTEPPAQKVSLSGKSSGTWTVVFKNTVLETMDEYQMFREAYPGAVIFHQGERYVVEETDRKNLVIRVKKSQDNYRTRSLHTTDIRILSREKTCKHGSLFVHYGSVLVSTQMLGYSVLEYDQIVATHPLETPAMEFTTKACWITPDAEGVITPAEIAGALHGAEHALIAAMPVHVLCDRSDIGGVSTPFHPDAGDAAIFIYDGVPGGVGLAEKAAAIFPEIIRLARDMVAGCSCETGCPSCIHSPKCGNNNQPLSKAGTVALLSSLVSGL
ncbi:DEAD/DEAH box helicase [Methanorbis furvi]|uniref:DEAD-box ATP-dependent RNA helicase CshB n=1 Tax=Methanorbis furvi TaxID=3028299 RepID=A0AAE4SA93_9EURY|nr:DEAD-box ATP-dependent RNA helicase CshB [Methanocorpusculaceae archaeon Ag1]